MKKTTLKDAIIFILLLIAGLVFFVLAHKAATITRGYVAYGGEILLAILPMIIYYAFVPTVVDAVSDISQLFKELDDEDEDEYEYEDEGDYSFGALFRETVIEPLKEVCYGIAVMISKLRLKLRRAKRARIRRKALQNKERYAADNVLPF